MKTTALRLHGKMDLRLDTFELPEPTDEEILAEVICDSLCMSSYKAAEQGPDHKRIPKDCAENPVIIGHEFCGRLLKVGAKWKDKFSDGDHFGIQPALNYKGSLDAPGYSFHYIGGDATHILIPSEVMEMDCLLHYKGDAFYMGSLAEPMSCIIGSFKAQYHWKHGSYEHLMGIIEGGNTALLAGAGPMGLGAANLFVRGSRRPGLLVVTDIDQARLDRAKSIVTPEMAEENGIKLIYLNTSQGDPVGELMALSEGKGYDDVFVFAPVAAVIEQGDAVLTRNGCLNFFAGPTSPDFSARFNFYNIHYADTHIVGTSGGNTQDMRDALDLMAKGVIDPSIMVTHVGGLTSAAETTLHLPEVPGGKKLLYTHIDMELTAIEDFAKKGAEKALFAELAEICERNNNLWCLEAERVLLEKGPKLQG